MLCLIDRIKVMSIKKGCTFNQIASIFLTSFEKYIICGIIYFLKSIFQFKKKKENQITQFVKLLYNISFKK